MRKSNDLGFLDSFFDPFFIPSVFDKSVFNSLKTNQMPTNFMKTDIREKDNEYLIEVDIPGVDKEDIEITLVDGYLSITAKKEEKTETKEDGVYIRQERYYGSQSRRIYVGDEITENDISAKFDKGVLELIVPKKEAPEPEKKSIQIN